MRARGGKASRLGAAAIGVVSLGSVLVLPSATAQAAPFAGASAIAVSTCAVLAPGATGTAVSVIQKLIGASPDGDFGPQTHKALKAWQKKNSVKATGVVDVATWAAMPLATGEKACGSEVAGTGISPSCAVLEPGASGLAVDVLQIGLGIKADGAYGAATRTAVKAAQASAKLHTSGATHHKTWKALHLLGTPACSIPSTIGPRPPSDAAKQAKIHARVVTMAASLAGKPGTTRNPLALRVISFEKKQIGKPYQWGATGPSSYDCSGLQMTSYLHAGVTIPRVSAAQYASAGTPEPLSEAKRGDLLFYASDVTKPDTVYHVAMYYGNGQLLDAPQTGEDVSIQTMWTTNLLPVVIRPVASLSFPVKPGASGYTVTQLQLALNRHHAGLTVDGGYGGATKAAVIAWQKAHKLKANGVVTATTWLTLA